MLPSCGFFNKLPCPFFASGLCERPHCHFSHEKKGDSRLGLPTTPAQPTEEDQSNQLLQYVNDALRRVRQDMAQVSSLGYVPTPMVTRPPEPKPRRYIPAQSVPQYRPTPLAELRRRCLLPIRAPTQLNQTRSATSAAPACPVKQSKSPEQSSDGGSQVNGSAAADDDDADMVQEEVDAIVRLKDKRLGGLDGALAKPSSKAEAAADVEGADKALKETVKNESVEKEKKEEVKEQENKGEASRVKEEDESMANGEIAESAQKEDSSEEHHSGPSSSTKGHSSSKHHSSTKHSSSKSSQSKHSSSKHSSSKHSSKERSSKESSSKVSSSKEQSSKEPSSKESSSKESSAKKPSSKGTSKESSSKRSKESSSKRSSKEPSAKDSTCKESSPKDNSPKEISEDSPSKESPPKETPSNDSSSKESCKVSHTKGPSEDSSSKAASKPPSKESSNRHSSSKHSSSKHPSKHSSSKNSSSHHSSSKHSSSKHSSSKQSSSKHSSHHSSSKHSSSSRHPSSNHSSSKHSSSKHSLSNHSSKRSSSTSATDHSSSKKRKEDDSKSSHHSSSKRSSGQKHSSSSSSSRKKEASAEESDKRGAKSASSESEDSSSGASSCQERGCDEGKKNDGVKVEPLTDRPSFELEWDLESEEEEDPVEECLRIFNEASQPNNTPVMANQERVHVKRPAESTLEPAVPSKKRVAHNPDLARRPAAAAPRGLLAHVSAAQAMHNRFAQLQQRFQAAGQGRVAPVANAPLLAAARRSALAQLPQGTRTAAHVVASQPKGQPRVAHVPAVVLSKRPTIPAEYGSRVPTAVRQRYLNLFVDECVKCSSTEDEAIQKALSEEKQTYDRSSSKTVYLNVAVNTLKRLRREVAQEGGVSSAGSGSSGTAATAAAAPVQTSNRVVSHEMVLQGARAARTSFSIEKNRYRKPPPELTASRFYELLEPYRLSTEQLVEYNYPRSHPTEPGRAIFGGTDGRQYSKLNDSMLRCSRCGAMFSLTEDGDYVRSEECVHHWGRLWKKRIAGALESRYSCCEGDGESDGCCVAKGHVHEGPEPSQLTGFVSTLAKSPPPGGGCPGVYALDCEMCYTSEGVELTRVTVVGWDLQPVYETLVKPRGKILDYNTRFSGLTEEDMVGVETNLRDVQAALLARFSADTLLLGHSLDSDLRALRLVHGHVVDTAAVFPHRRGLPYKRALRTLMAEHLSKIIQNGVDGHDSQEDAAACMELMLWKVRDDLKKGIR
ncbi:uncharacterized protein LOC142560840 [Dermacentor variabilis]|uniref:uncharacterized protein LOC142560840 n=1 Tax=Dermacentor variabilis TaxID=34621 RepID=UPI003F5BD63C